MTACTQLMEGASAGVAPALRAVDCVAGETTASAFNRLFGAEGAMAPALTILLTLYIAFFAISLLTGRSRIGISALTPRMMTLGVVLTFATSWIAYQGVLWNLAVGAPDWIATVLTGSNGSATQIFADRIDIVFAAIGQVGESAGSGGEQAGGGAGSFAPADAMWLGALLLLLGTVGVLLTARITLALLLALGPIFVVLALFQGTRGLTAGWLRGVALTALTPLFVVLGGSITLELIVPVLAALMKGTDGVSGRAAMALFTMAAVHVALMVMVFKVAGTMVSGWKVFGLASDGSSGSARDTVSSAAAVALPAGSDGLASPYMAAGRSGRPSMAAAAAAHGPTTDSGQNAGSGSTRSGDRRTVVTHVSGGGIERARQSGPDRARGIGSRFRSASNDTGMNQLKEKAR